MDPNIPLRTSAPQSFEILRKQIGDLYLSLRLSRQDPTTASLSQKFDGLRQLIDHAILGIYRSTIEGQLVMANAALARMFGYDSPEDMLEAVTDIGRQLYAEPEARIAWQHLCAREEIIGPLVWKGSRRTREALWLEEHTRVIRDAHGHLVGYEGVVLDVTARYAQKALSQKDVQNDLLIEEADAGDGGKASDQVRQELADARQMIAILREQLDRFEIATMGSQEGLWEGRTLPDQPWDSPETPAWYSLQFKTLLGFDAHEFPPVLASWAERIHPDDREPVFRALRDHIEHHLPYEVESRLRTKQGEYRWFKAKGQALFDDQGTFIRGGGTIRDITEEREAEEAIKRKHALLTTVVEGTSDIIFVKDHEGRYLLVNSTAASILGLPIDAIIGKKDEELFPDGTHPLFTKFDHDVIRKKSPQSFEIDVVGDGAVSRTFLVTKDIFGQTEEGLEGLFGIARDITFRKAAELMIQERGKRYRAIMENANDLIAEVNVEGRFLYVSPSFQEALGYTHSELLNSNMFSLVHPGDCERVMAEFQEGLETEEASRLVYRYKNSHGEYRWLESTGNAFRTALGERRAVVVSRDVTQRKQSDDALEAIVRGNVVPGAPNFFEILVGELAKVLNLPMVLLFECLDRCQGKARILAFWNHDHFEPPSEYNALGGPCENVLKGHPVAYASGVQQLFPESETLKAFAVEAYFGFPLVNSKAEVVGTLAIMDTQPLRLSAQGRYLLEIFAARAGTELERKRAQEALQESQERYRALYDQSPLLYFTVDAHLAILSVNQYGADLLGYTIQELVGQSILSVLDPEDHQAFLAKITKSFAAVNQTFQNEWRKVKKDGNRLWVKETWRTIIGPNQQPILLLSCEDITAKKRAEEALEMTEKQLRHTQKMEAVGTLAGGIAHDFNNILGAILGYSELALAQASQEPKLISYLEEVLTAGNRAKELVKQILAFSRRSDHEREAVDMNVIVQEALRMVRATLPSTVEIQATFTMDSAVVFADPTQIHQVIMNLCANAEHAMRERGGLLTLTVTSIEVQEDNSHGFPELKPGTYLQLTIQDSGQGMSSQVVERIFEPFFTTKGLGEGTGLGLAVVHGIIVGHEGHIAVSSVVGQGTTVTIFLPRLDVVLPAQTANAVDWPQGSGTVLFVDDEDVLARWGGQILTHLGYSVVTKTNPYEAVELFQREPDAFDVVVTDQTMPTMSGEDLACALLQIRGDIPIVLCTGFSHTMSAEKAAQLGLKGFLMKPVNGAVLANTLRDILPPGQQSDASDA